MGPHPGEPVDFTNGTTSVLALDEPPVPQAPGQAPTAPRGFTVGCESRCWGALPATRPPLSVAIDFRLDRHFSSQLRQHGCLLARSSKLVGYWLELRNLTNCGAEPCKGAGPPLRLSPRHPTLGGRGNPLKGSSVASLLPLPLVLEEKRKLRSILNFGNFSNFGSQKRIANFKILTFLLKESPSI